MGRVVARGMVGSLEWWVISPWRSRLECRRVSVINGTSQDLVKI